MGEAKDFNEAIAQLISKYPHRRKDIEYLVTQLGAPSRSVTWQRLFSSVESVIAFQERRASGESVKAVGAKDSAVRRPHLYAAALFNDVSDHIEMLGGIGTSDAAQPKSNAAERTIIAIGSRIGGPNGVSLEGAFANHEFRHCCMRC